VVESDSAQAKQFIGLFGQTQNDFLEGYFRGTVVAL
jgi:hypothetical protein